MTQAGLPWAAGWLNLASELNNPAKPCIRLSEETARNTGQ